MAKKIINVDILYTSKGGKDAIKETKTLGAATGDLGKKISTTNKQTTDLGSQFRYLSLVAGLAAGGVIALTKSFVNSAQEMQDAQLKLGVYALSAGEDLDAVNAAANKLYSTGIIPLTDASTAYANLLATGLGLEKSTQLINTFVDAIVVGKESITDTYGDALVKATLGIRIFQERQADASGINTQFNKVFQEFAQTLGTTANKLTNVQRYQALFNFYMKEGERFTGATELATMTLSGTLSKLSANFILAKAAVGNALIPVISTLATLFGKISKIVVTLANRFPALTMAMIIGAAAATVLTAAFAGFAATTLLLKTGLGALGITLAAGIAGFWQVIGVATAAVLVIGLLTYGVLKLTGQWDKYKNSMKELTIRMSDIIKPMKQTTEQIEENTKQLAKLNTQIFRTTRSFKENVAKWVQDHKKAVKDIGNDIDDLTAKYKDKMSEINKSYTDSQEDMSIAHARRVED